MRVIVQDFIKSIIPYCSIIDSRSCSVENVLVLLAELLFLFLVSKSYLFLCSVNTYSFMVIDHKIDHLLVKMAEAERVLVNTLMFIF